jgi:hypothetical protein
MNWKELIERTDEMMQVNSEDIINNPAEVNALIEGWNLLMKNEPELNSKQKNVYFALMCARRIFMLNSNDQLLEIKKYYIK